MIAALLDRLADLPPVPFACAVLPLALAPIAFAALALWTLAEVIR